MLAVNFSELDNVVRDLNAHAGATPLANAAFKSLLHLAPNSARTNYLCRTMPSRYWRIKTIAAIHAGH
jgi:hypothetical protein